MKLYQTKTKTIINLDNIVSIYRMENGLYKMIGVSGDIFRAPDIDEEDIDRIMEYNDHLLK